MQLVDEMRNNGFIDNKVTPRIHSTVYEDNSGALEMASIHKYRPRTKHLNVKLHHFQQYVNDGSIKIIDIYTSTANEKSRKYPLFVRNMFLRIVEFFRTHTQQYETKGNLTAELHD